APASGWPAGAVRFYARASHHSQPYGLRPVSPPILPPGGSTMSVRLAATRCPRPPCQDFAASVPATRGLLAAPWTPLASLSSVGGQHVGTVSGSQSEPLPGPCWSLTPAPVVGVGQTCPRPRRLSMNDTLCQALKQLRLSGLLQNLDVRLQEAASHGLNHAE